MKTSLKLLSVLLITTLTWSCEKDSKPVYGEYYYGTFIVSEGTWGSTNSSLAWLGESYGFNNAFRVVNNRALGDVFQSMSYDEDFYYFVLNSSNKVEICDRNTLKSVGVISDITSPRYVVVANDKIYISQWGENAASPSIEVYSKEFQKIKSISVDLGPEKMLVRNNELWVVNSGGWAQSNTISVIDTKNDSFKKTIILSGQNPVALKEYLDGSIWVLCSGYKDWTNGTDIPAKIVKINAEYYLESGEFLAFNEGFHPSNFEFDSSFENIFVGGGFVKEAFKIDITNKGILSVPNPDSEYIYGINASENGAFYVCYAKNFTELGKVVRIDKDMQYNGYQLSPGIAPNAVIEIN